MPTWRQLSAPEGDAGLAVLMTRIECVHMLPIDRYICNATRYAASPSHSHLQANTTNADGQRHADRVNGTHIFEHMHSQMQIGKALVRSLIVCNDACLGDSMQCEAALGTQEVGDCPGKPEPGSILLLLRLVILCGLAMAPFWKRRVPDMRDITVLPYD